MNHPPPPPAGAPRTAALDSLRSLLTLLVVAHHAVLAYFVYAPPPGAFDATLLWAAFPVIDAARAPGVDALVLWNDSFFMALLFLLAGLFTGPSLARKGAGGFVFDRFVRLGLPFIVAAGVLAPLAYYPAFLQRESATAATGFVDAWAKLGAWPAGPAWFLWVLLAFSALAALLHAAWPRALEALGRAGAWCRERPARLVGVWIVAALLAYLPVVMKVHYMHWASWGPFFVQSSRVLLYATYFFYGVALGGRENGARDLVAPDGPLARRWVRWQVAAGLVFAGFVATVIVTAIQASRGEFSLAWSLAAGALMMASGVLTSTALLAWAARQRSVENAFWASLRRNAYGIYLVHYAVVIWLQFALLRVALPGLAKALLVTAAGVALSWALAAALRRLPGLRGVL
ncbi:acyltransferase family protein [Oleiharenicola sp. Vm1]|uniref:acyltransferase family protein n=1 Tax=Oleiharenicola sp. Vm1 TaxID=3398393 RepID=UPI0039F55FC4